MHITFDIILEDFVIINEQSHGVYNSILWCQSQAEVN